MLQLRNAKTNEVVRNAPESFWMPSPDLSKVCELQQDATREVLDFLSVRPVHTVVMTSLVNDNGIASELNRGKFYGYRNSAGKLDGVALIGHTTLVETRSDAALTALATIARTAETPIHLIMSSADAAQTFWNRLTHGLTRPRLTCTELLFELNFPFLVQECEWNVRLATPKELIPVAAAQAEVAEIECGVNPLRKDREGFLRRVMRRIEQGRVFVVFDGDKLVFKADIIAETENVIYLEGVYTGGEYRGKGIGSKCLSALSLQLVSRAENICMLSNVDFTHAHKSFRNAGYKHTAQCTTLFV